MHSQEHLGQDTARSRILTLIRQLLEERGVEEGEITPAASFRGTFGFDSLEIADLVVELEELFKVDIPDDDLAKVATVGGAIDYILEAKAA